MNDDFARYVICYDIPGDRRRNKLARMLDGFGQRRQMSVFELHLNPKLFDIVERNINQIISVPDDKVIIYPICAACSKKIRTYGKTAGEGFSEDEYVYIA